MNGVQSKPHSCLSHVSTNMSTRDEQLQMLDDCEKRDTHLSDSEAKIIDSLAHYMDRGGFLSVEQDELLEKIWDRVTDKG